MSLILPGKKEGWKKSEQLIQDLEELLGDDFSDEEAEQLREKIQEKHKEKQGFLGEHKKPFFKGPQFVIFCNFDNLVRYWNKTMDCTFKI